MVVVVVVVVVAVVVVVVVTALRDENSVFTSLHFTFTNLEWNI